MSPDASTTADLFERVLMETYGERFPGFDASRLTFESTFNAELPNQGQWAYSLSWGKTVVSGVCYGPFSEASMLGRSALWTSVSCLDQILKMAWQLDTAGPTGAQWLGWR